MSKYNLVGLLTTAGILTACQPTVKLEAPEKPIVINLNVKLKVEKELDKTIANNPDIF